MFVQNTSNVNKKASRKDFRKILTSCVRLLRTLIFQDGKRLFIGAPGGFYWQGK